MHSIQSVRQSVTVSHTWFPRLAPPSGLRGSCVEAILIYCDMLTKGDMPAEFPVLIQASMPPDLTGVKIQ